MDSHVIDSSEPYHPEKLAEKEYVGAAAYFEQDLRAGVILRVEEFPEMRKPSYKIEVDFGPVIGRRWSSAQITNYARSDLVGRTSASTLSTATANRGSRRPPTLQRTFWRSIGRAPGGSDDLDTCFKCRRVTLNAEPN